MSLSTSFVACPEVQAGLLEPFDYDNLAPDDAAVIEYVLSGINRNGFIQEQINMRPNGIRDFRAVYGQRFLASQVEDSGRISCSSGFKDGVLSKVYSIDPDDGSRLTMTITPEEMRAQCATDKNFMNREIRKMMDAILQRMNINALTAISLNLGNFAYDVDSGNPAGTTTYLTTTTRNSEGILLPNAHQDVNFHFRANGFSKMPFGIGGKTWWDYAGLVGAACCNEQGIDVGMYAARKPFGFTYDQNVISVLGDADRAVFLAPGAVQMIWFNQFRGGDQSILAVNTPQLQQGILVYPDDRFPVEFDYRAELVCVDDVFSWNISLALPHDFVFMPEDMYQVGDRKEGVNGILGFEISNP